MLGSRARLLNQATKFDLKCAPGQRPLRLVAPGDLDSSFQDALRDSNGLLAAHCIHELWMRDEMAINIERMLERLWAAGSESVPDWLPMRHVDWLPQVDEIAAKFKAAGKGRSNIYLILLDYSDRVAGPHGIYVGMTHYTAAELFDQHKAGIRAAGSVLKRGLEPLIGPACICRELDEWMRRA